MLLFHVQVNSINKNDSTLAAWLQKMARPGTIKAKSRNLQLNETEYLRAEISFKNKKDKELR